MVEKKIEKAIEALLEERRTFKPPEDFADQANINDASVYESASEDPDAWWASQAERLDWFEKWDTVLEWKAPHHKWFLGGKLNAAHNCVDRHAASVPDRVAYHWIGEPEGEARTITYKELYEEVCRLANVLVDLGVRKGDRVAIYMPMIPELPAAMLACARIGAAHSVVFGGFSAESLSDRINDAECKVLITADGGYRRGQTVELKKAADEAIQNTPSIEKVLMVRRTKDDVNIIEGRDVIYNDVVPQASGSTRPSPWIPRTCSTSSTRRARPVSRKASCTRPAATSPECHRPTGPSSTSSPRPTSTGVPRTSAGSPVTVTSSTAPWRTDVPRCSTRVRPTGPTRTAGGTSSRSTRSRSSTARRQLFARS